MIIRKATEADSRAIHLVESTCFPPLEAADEQCIKERCPFYKEKKEND